ncbi:hypothetical protein Dform_01090 [Dehalogenimonas formicexedens]|uniref:DUF4399 domain-containing protein n=1 Tax=Dehalogenimonas formicexedens TaxID=1839801 RepID=A0A1P8F7K9_9CHLR|nr:hypothetical protein [Dehalogenimonas formicexedens]APV44425.1 hypothetical protein Dform_01090 [Dehalogenimonas formicexedens]
MRKVFVILIGVLFLAAVPLCSCQPTEPLYPIQPQVLLLSPAYGSVLASGDITIKAYVESVDLVDKVGQENVPGEGHLIYYLDVMPPVVTSAAAIPGSGQYATSSQLSYIWLNVQPGEHILAVQVVNNDNTPMENYSAVWITITVK